MNKAEKLQHIKKLQSEASSLIKEKQFEKALEKIDEILALAPNLQKIKDLKRKIEKKVNALKKTSSTISEEKPVEQEKIPEKTDIPDTQEIPSEQKMEKAKLEEKEEIIQKPKEIESQETKEKEPKEEEVLLELEKLMENQEETKKILDGSSPLPFEEKSPLESQDVSSETKQDGTHLSIEQELESFLGSEEKEISDTESKEKPVQEKSQETEKISTEESIKPDIDFSRIMDEAISSEGKDLQSPEKNISSEKEEEINFKLDLEAKETKEQETETAKPEEEKAIPEAEKVITKEEIDQKLKNLLNKSKETEEVTEEASPETEKYEVEYSGGIPTVKGGKKKEKLDYEFKISEEPGVSPSAKTPKSPYENLYKPNIDTTFDAASRKGFKLSLIPQAMGFALNLERMLYLTIGILFSIALTKLFYAILPRPYNGISAILVSNMVNIFFLSFIAYTIILQMNQHIHGNFRAYLSDFTRKCGGASLAYWPIYFISLVVVGGITSVLFYLAKFGSAGTLIYSLLSLPSFILLVIFVLLLLASPLLSFIVPALIAVEKTRMLETFVESIRLLKHHLFTILGGYLYTLLLSVFLSFILILVYTISVVLLVVGGSLLGGTSFVKLIQNVPSAIFGPAVQLIHSAQLPIMLPMGQASSGGDLASYIFLIMLVIGISFLITIPIIFITGGGVITYLSLKERMDIHKNA